MLDDDNNDEIIG